MRQLRFVYDDFHDARHWKRSSALCRTLDSADWVVDVASKKQVRSALQAGVAVCSIIDVLFVMLQALKRPLVCMGVWRFCRRKRKAWDLQLAGL